MAVASFMAGYEGLVSSENPIIATKKADQAGSGPPHGGLAQELGVVDFRVVEGKMQAAAFLAADGAVHDERGDRDEVA